MTRGLLLVGHGSRRNRFSSEAVCMQAERIRRRGAVDEVAIAFVKEEPALSGALTGLRTDLIDVVPMFASAGYYTEEIIPRELGLAGVKTIRGGQTIRYCAPVGTHPGVAGILIERAQAAGADPTTSVLVLGHGTPRNENSSTSVYTQAARVRGRGLFAEVCVAFIDQEPNLTRVWELTNSLEVVMVPFLMAEGWHVRETVPNDLSLAAGTVSRGHRTLRMTEAVGTHPGIAEIILDLM